jgi:hypothetical protein
VETTVAPTVAPTAAATAPTPFAPTPARLDPPIVTLPSAPIPIARTLALTRSTVAPGDEEAARWGVEWYLQGLDRYRDNGDFLPVTGAFGKAVAAALVESRTPGVKRSFLLESLRVEALYRKPWGTQALADVRVTIVDRAADRSVPDQREIGLLRLSGDRRLQVIDAWDASAGRWFNGRPSDTDLGLREAVAQAVGWHLSLESWVIGLPPDTYYNGVDATPFKKARAAYVATFDRTTIKTRIFTDVAAVIERFETFAEINGGIATMRLTGTVTTTDADGRAGRETVTRRVKVFFGNWAPEVVDEEVTPGVWRSGGDLALVEIDVNRA